MLPMPIRPVSPTDASPADADPDADLFRWLARSDRHATGPTGSTHRNPDTIAAVLADLCDGYSLDAATARNGTNRMTWWRWCQEMSSLRQATLRAKNSHGGDALDATVDAIVRGELTGADGKPRPAPHPAYVAMAYKRRGLLLDHAPASVAIDARQVRVQVQALTPAQLRELAASIGDGGTGGG